MCDAGADLHPACCTAPDQYNRKGQASSKQKEAPKSLLKNGKKLKAVCSLKV